ncbi:hypothetical protein [Bacillus seohaeanensis]|uniref:DUF5659 domain-containing protein n=1 Tax=Bacillus seohaeanensis TaxID=284580 RepID=A0ABW5RR89_9BACI
MRTDNYNCFSYYQKEFLVANGLTPLREMVHSKTGKTFWIFSRSEEKLSELLVKWTNNRK